jgi:serine/threonine-protein kinase
MSFQIGATIGAYTITDQLGKGGMATVYKAHHNKLKRDVAIKVMHPTYSGEETFIRRFEREARVVARLEHPHIVPVYDYAVHEGHPYLVMRYIEGETLKERLNEGNLSKREILRITDAIADALDYAHGEGVLHRDIKPSNILLTAGRGVYIADFGLARVMQSGESTLSQGMIMGTPHYISPEQAKGVAELDGRADLYSYGIILYEMTTGRVPFRADSDFSIIHSQIFDAPPLPSMINDDINPQLEMLLLKVLEKEPDARYGTAGEMAAALHSALGDMPSNIAPAGKTALPDYTPMAMTQPEAGNPIKATNPIKEPSVTDVLAGLKEKEKEAPVMPDPTATPTPPISVVVEKKGGKKRTAVLIGGGIIGGIALCICLLLAIGALTEKYGGDTVSVATPERLPMERQPDPNGDPDALFVPVNTDRIRPLQELIALAEEDPDDRVLITELAIAHLEAGDWDSAVALVERRFADVRTPLPFVRTAEVLLENGRVDLAYITLEQAMDKFSDNPRLLANGEVQRMLMIINIWYEDQYGLGYLLEQITNTPSPATSPLVPLLEASLLVFRDDEIEAAEQALLRTIEEDTPYPADAYFLLGAVYDRTAAYDDGYSARQNALALNPPNWMRTIIELSNEE